MMTEHYATASVCSFEPVRDLSSAPEDPEPVDTGTAAWAAWWRRECQRRRLPMQSNYADRDHGHAVSRWLLKTIRERGTMSTAEILTLVRTENRDARAVQQALNRLRRHGRLHCQRLEDGHWLIQVRQPAAGRRVRR